MTVFIDTDDTAWLIHSSNWNKTLNISRLTADYAVPDGNQTVLYMLSALI